MVDVEMIDETQRSRRGIQNKPLLLSRKQNPAMEKIDYILTEEDCQRLLIEYPELEEEYDTRVSMNDNNNEQN